MFLELLVLINTILLIVIAYPYLKRAFSQQDPFSNGEKSESTMMGYVPPGPVRIEDADSFDYSEVFDNNGWRNMIGTKLMVWGSDPTTETGASAL